ncbi:MAG: type II toxin-antitoxin system HipA family toxin [Kiloniellales bacterium]
MPGKLPPFILSLLPEGWLERVLKDSDERALLRSGKRYMSNITISERAADLVTLPADILVSRLADHSRDGLFLGSYAGPGRGDIEQSFEDNLARLYASADTPRLSGVQIKAPMFLDEAGRLAPSTGLPFTHILKPAGTSGFQALPVIEYLAMALGHHAGLEAPRTALVAMPDDMPPALIVERFDIRTSSEDKRRIALEDLCSVLDLPPEAKYDGTIERIARAIRPLSTTPEDDLFIVIKRALFAWLIADGDMHLKNLAILKVALPNAHSFDTVRLAPLYDAVTTRVFPHLEHDRMALKLNGKDDRLRRADFLKLAATAGIAAGPANAAIDRMLHEFAQGLDVVSVPAMSGFDSDIAARAERMLALCRERLGGFA